MKAVAAKSFPPFWNTRGAVVFVAIAVFSLPVMFLAPYSRTAIVAVFLTDGFLAAAWTAGACACGAFLLRTFKIEGNRLLFLATAGGLGLGVFSLAGLGLGLAGILNRKTAIALAVISAILFGLQWLQQNGGRIDGAKIKKWLNERAGLSWLWLVPVVSLAIACVAASVLPAVLWKPLDPHPYDVTSYHLQVPREWFEAGRIEPLAHNVYSYFPFNVEMHYLMLMHVTGGPWNAMYACQFMSVAFAVLMVLAVAGAVSPEGNPAVAAAIVSAVPWIIMLAGVAYVESAMLLYTTLAIAWTLRSIHQNHTTRATMVLAGIMAGFACGVKITSVPMLLLAIPIAIVGAAFLQSPKKIKSSLAPCAIFILAGLLILSPWLIRNFIWTGNPVFPVAMKSFGHAHFSMDQVERFRIAHSPRPDQQSFIARLEILWTDVLGSWQYGFVLLPVAILLGILRCREHRTLAMLLLSAIILAVWISFTHLLPRFLLMEVPIAAILVGRWQWGKTWPVAVILILIAASVGWMNIVQEMAKITRDPDSSGLIGVQDLSFLVPGGLANMISSNKQVALVGDAQAFLYQVPMTRLHYRTVFDIPPDQSDAITAWAGAQSRGNPDWLLVINPAEIRRLHDTYYKIPALPKAWEDKDRPFVLHGDDADK